MVFISTEIGFWLLITLMMAIIILHFTPYVIGAWKITSFSSNNNNTGVPLYTHVSGFVMLGSALVGLFGGAAYYFPATLLRPDQEYCTGGNLNGMDTPLNCPSPEQAGSKPIAMVFFPTLFMYPFDFLGCLGIQRRPPCCNRDGTECRYFWKGVQRVILPRFGSMMVYAAAILYAGNLQARMKREELQVPNNDDDEGSMLLLDYAKRLTRAGHIALALGCILFGVAAPSIYRHAKEKKYRGVSEADTVELTTMTPSDQIQLDDIVPR